MSSRDNRSNNSLNLQSTLKSDDPGRRKDSIPFRIQFVQDLLRDKTLRPLIDFNHIETEYFKNGTDSENETEFGDSTSNDTRHVLHKRVHDFYDIIEQIGGRVQYVKSGTTGHTFKGSIECKDKSTFEYAVKVVAYPKKEKYGTIYDSDRPENAEIKMLRLLGYFISNKQTPHIVLPIATFNTSINPFLTLLEKEVVDDTDKKYIEFLTNYKEGKLHDEVSILLSEWANRGDLLDYIRRNYKRIRLMHWKVFLFQIISTLAVIQSKFPAFRHNDFKPNNILLHKISRDKLTFSYRVVRKNYIVPNMGYSIKLWDFDFSCIPGIVDNIKVTSEWTKPINVHNKRHQYYDIHYFFNTLAFAGFVPGFMTSQYIPTELKEFIKRVIPEKYRSVKKICNHKEVKENDKKNKEFCDKCYVYVHPKGRLLVDDEYITPVEILSDPFFEEFIKKPVIKKSVSKLENKSENKLENKTENKPEIKLVKKKKPLVKKSTKQI